MEDSKAVLMQLRPTQEKVDLAVRAAVETVRPSRVYLFGSWARGETRWDSDLDMAVLLPDGSSDELGRIRKQLRQRLDEVPMTIDLILATESYAKEFTDSINSILHSILHRGKLVYDNCSEAERSHPAA